MNSSKKITQLMAIFDSLKVAFSIQECSDLFTQELENRLALLMTRSHPPLLIATFKSCDINDEQNPAGGNLNKLCDGEAKKKKLLYCRQLAQKLHASIQTFCPDPMCVLSLVAEKEEDLAGKAAEAVAKASRVLHFSRTVMTQAKYESILKALETQLGFSAFQAALTKRGSVKTEHEPTMTKESIRGIRNTFRVFGHEILNRGLRRPRLTLCHRLSTGEWSLQRETPDIGSPSRPRQPFLLFSKSSRCPETELEASEYGQMSPGKISSHREFLLTDFMTCASADLKCFRDAVQGLEVMVWILHEEPEVTPRKILERLSSTRFTVAYLQSNLRAERENGSPPTEPIPRDEVLYIRTTNAVC